MLTVDRWALVVIRGNGIDFEILSELFQTETEAQRQADWHATRWKNVQIKVVLVIVHVPIEEKDEFR